MSGATVRSRATEESSSTSSSPTVLTPSSDSASVAFSRDEADVRTFNPDDAIPSIEDNAASTLVSTTHRRQVGRVSLPAQGSAMSTPSRPVPEGSTSARPLNRQHAESDGNLHVSELFPAIEGVERGSDTPARSQSAPLQARSPRPSRASRRRSQPIHQVASEEPPPDRYHEPEFQNALSNAKRQMSRLVDTLASSSIHTEPDSRMQSLFGQALELACFQCPTTRTVGFVGDSGVGKSSLLNALLDQQALARVSNAGAACTCVVTEFRYHDQDDFVIQVDMFSDNELFDQVRSLVKAYRSFHHPDGDFESEDQRQVAQNMAQVAADTFTAMFRGHLDDFDVLIGEPEPIVMSKLLSLIGECRPNNLERRRTLSTFDSCRNLLGRLTSESPTTEGPAAWPYIHKVSVYLRAHILTGGLVMVDLPGLHDRNSARQLITETYLRECDEILAVCNIGRAVSDAGVKSVFDLARKARLSNVGIVCTKSDLDVELDESDTDLAEAADFIKLLAERLRWLDEEISDLLDDGDSSSAEELASLMRERQEKRVRINTAKFELDRTLINRRNAHVAAGLVELYSTQDRPIEVFCVSNTMYRKHRDEPGDVALPYLSLSGIISLRRHCISIVSRSQFRLAKHYIQDKIPALLIDLRLWVESGARSGIAERRAAIRRVLSDVEGRLERGLNGRASGVNTIARSLRQDFDNQIVTVGMLSTEQWRRGALNATRVWDGWAWATYAAFCRNYGDYWTDAVKGHVWNEEAMETMVGDLEAPWDELRSGLEDQFRNFVESVRETVENAADFMESRLEYSDSAAVVHSALDSRCQLLVTDLEDAWDQFERNLDGLRTDALSGIRTSFFGRAMEGAYNEARTFSGKGSHARRKMVINRTINSQDMFRGHMRTFSRRFDAIVTAFETGAREMVRTHLGGLRESLDMLRSENIAMESERDEAFRQRVQRAERSARQEMERIQTVATN